MNLKEMSAIDKVIYYSRKILILKLYKFQVERLQATRLATQIRFSEEIKNLRNLELKEINSIMIQLFLQIKLLLNPLFQGHNFGYYIINNWTLTEEELKQGYIELLESVDSNKRYILFLKDYQDSTHRIKRGELVILSKIGQILPNYKNMINNSKSLLQLPESYKIYLKQTSNGNKKT